MDAMAHAIGLESGLNPVCLGTLDGICEKNTSGAETQTPTTTVLYVVTGLTGLVLFVAITCPMHEASSLIMFGCPNSFAP